MARIRHVKNDPEMDDEDIILKSQDRPTVSPAALQVASTPTIFRRTRATRSKKSRSVRKSIEECSLLEVFTGDVIYKSQEQDRPKVSPLQLNTAVYSRSVRLFAENPSPEILVGGKLRDRNGRRNRRNRRYNVEYDDGIYSPVQRIRGDEQPESNTRIDLSKPRN